MFKKFKKFESHLRDRQSFRLSKTKKPFSQVKNIDIEKIVDLSYFDLKEIEDNQLQIELSTDNELQETEPVLIIKPTTFQIKKVGEINFDYFKVFEIIGTPDKFPIKYALISSVDFNSNKYYKTLNLNKIQRGDAAQEIIMIKMLGVILGTPIYNGVNFENYNKKWEEDLEYYENIYPEYVKKIGSQIDQLLKNVGYDWDYVYKDNPKFFLYEKASELFYNDSEFRNRKYRFNRDKWNPSDFWFVKGDLDQIKNDIFKIDTLEELNDYLARCMRLNKGIVGVSHKLNRQLDKVWVNKVNFEGSTEPFEHKYLGYILRENSMSVDIRYQWNNTLTNQTGTGSIVVRNFSSGDYSKVGLELVSNKGHMSGKLTGFLKPLFSKTDFFELQDKIIELSSEEILENIEEFKLKEKIKKDFISTLEDGKFEGYRLKSRLQGLLIVDKLEKLYITNEKYNNPQDLAIHQMISYGRSQTDISSSHYVVK